MFTLLKYKKWLKQFVTQNISNKKRKDYLNNMSLKTKGTHKSEATQMSFIKRFNKKNPINKSWFFWTAIIGLALLSIVEYVDAHTGFLRGYKMDGAELINEDIRIAFAWTATTGAAIGLFKLIRQDKDWLWWFAYGVIALGINGMWLGKLAQLIKRIGQVSILFYSGYVWSSQAKKHLPESAPMPPKGIMPITSSPRSEMGQALLAIGISLVMFGYILPQFLPDSFSIFEGSAKLFGKYQTGIIQGGELISLEEWNSFVKTIPWHEELGLHEFAHTYAQGTKIMINSPGGGEIQLAQWINTSTGNTMSTIQEYFDSIAIWGAFWGSWSMVNKRWQAQSFKFAGDFMTLIGYLLMGSWVSVFSQLIFNIVQLFGMTDWKEQSDYNIENGLTTVEAYVNYKFADIM